MAESFADGAKPGRPGCAGYLQCGAGCDPCLAGCHQLLAFARLEGFQVHSKGKSLSELRTWSRASLLAFLTTLPQDMLNGRHFP